MHDQADFLRRLVLERRLGPNIDGPAPQMLAVVGAKGGVGATTIAVNLSVALAQFGQRVVLVDADLRGGNVDALCQLDDGEGLFDILDGRRSVHEVLRRGPAGVQVIAAHWNGGPPPDYAPAAHERLLRQITGLGPFADVVLVDAGSGLCPRIRRMVEAADGLLMVTTPDNVALMDAYASIKSLATSVRPAWVGTVVNLAESADEAADVNERVARCCRKFLGRTVDHAPWTPRDAAVGEAATIGRPYVLSTPDAPASRGAQRLAAYVLAEALSERTSSLPTLARAA